VEPCGAGLPKEVTSMKNIQVIDGAMNCSYDLFSVTEDEFAVLFPEIGQDIEFIEDVIGRVGDESLGRMMRNVWDRPVKKSDVVGIHGTLFYELLWKKKYYPTKRSTELVS
jgi:hypothetical protein